MLALTRRPWVLLALLILIDFSAPPADARRAVTWARRRLSPSCEAPHVFYSAQHVNGAPPCCATIEGLCPGGTACPPSGTCANGKACLAGPVVDRPNIIFFMSDDQGACHYGNAGECRSTQTGTPLPPPKTPNLDMLEGYSTVFPIAHNTASWCFPSLATILTGRFQRSFHGQRKILETSFSTVPSVLRGLADDPIAPTDPYNAGNKIGGYCTILTGKFTGALDQTAFDAMLNGSARGSLGRNACVAGAVGAPPACGSATSPGYAPFTASRQSAVFEFLDMLHYPRPGTAPVQYGMQHFYVWYGPRIPHQPLRSPQVVLDYLFGGFGTFPRGGVMDLGQWCTGTACAPVVTAFNESNFGTDHDFYGNLWWIDDNIREFRRYLAEETAPHCIGPDGRSRFDVTNPAQCTGSWSGVTPDLERNTIFMYFSDNGWHLPSSKHAFTENGYRTRLVVYDPRALPAMPSWDAQQQASLPPRFVSSAVAHTTDLLPTALGFALGTSGAKSCPVGPDGQACDGRDLRPHLADAPGGPAAPETLRHSLCGHQTKRVASPTRNRYLVTRPGSVGRCTPVAGAACVASADCAPGQFCLGGHCQTAVAEIACSAAQPCPAGAACLGAKCRMGPVCLDSADCSALGPGYVCSGKEQRWCRNDPNVACSTNDDCPVCPSANGNPVPCKRLCESRILKLYVSPGSTASVQLSDLFLDPDETGLMQGNQASLINDISKVGGPYDAAIRKMNCCIDDWWPDIVAESGTLCTPAYACPSDLTCNE